MFRQLSVVVISFVVSTTLVAVSYIAAHRPEFPASLEQVVQIEGSCSGFIGDNNLVVTARHCINEIIGSNYRIDVRFFDGLHGKFTLATYGSDMETHDFAILSGDTRGIKPFVITRRIPKEDERCIHVGHGGGSVQQLAIYCMVAPPGGLYPNYIKLYSVAIPGDSGSAVMTGDLEVFGILVRSAFPIPSAFAVKIGQVADAINKLKRGKQ